jgi:hypothetical protein
VQEDVIAEKNRDLADAYDLLKQVCVCVCVCVGGGKEEVPGGGGEEM